MLNFASDYVEGAHPEILRRLCETNMEKLTGYGSDPYSASARDKIKAACQCEDADVHFLVGGTQTNQIVIASMMGASEGVISAETGHVNVHEAGAIEYTGHKVFSLPQKEGKLSASDVRTFLEAFWNDENHDHMVFPGMVYISHPTEYGTLYTKAELAALSEVCREFEIPLFLDGARLGYGLMSLHTDLMLPDIASLCDVFYIGGTKVGALCGEAVVFTKNNTPKHFITVIKRHGALLAKGRLLGIQFDTLFTDDLYMKISRHAIQLAEELITLLREKGYLFYLNSPTNQQFVILTAEQYERLKEEVVFSIWEKLPDGGAVVRFATSWATQKEDIAALAALL
ncbi:MAG: low specificity L-threonine aldolase [Clostridia bacterium]|nr:low specificity L-threonine aldolase [Clostridia bacterium]